MGRGERGKFNHVEGMGWETWCFSFSSSVVGVSNVMTGIVFS